MTEIVKLSRRIWNQRYLFLMSIPFILWFVVFKYIPLWGWSIAFQDYKIEKGFFEQAWVGLKHFKAVFADAKFYQVMRNTLGMSLLNLVLGFPMPIILALLINEIGNKHFKRSVQTLSYLPHFVSWIVVVGLASKMLASDGTVNALLLKLGVIDTSIQFTGVGKYFWWVVTFSDVWKEMGWKSIIYLSAISSIDPTLYEAADIDGAGRLRRIWHITLQGIRPTMVILLIMAIGNIVNIGFEKQMLFSNPMVKEYSEVLDLYALQYGIEMFRFSFGTAVGVFKSVVSIILLLIANTVSRRLGETGIY